VQQINWGVLQEGEMEPCCCGIYARQGRQQERWL
jgi:hypothetical protein